MPIQTLDPDFVARRTEESLRTPPVAASRMLEDHMNVDWRDMLPGINVPMLICAGEEDPQAPPPAADASAKLIPRAVARFAKSGHCPFIEEPEKFNRVLAEFVVGL
jgi:pimeloyl-ACP methyl ester carboxylesterase